MIWSVLAEVAQFVKKKQKDTYMTTTFIKVKKKSPEVKLPAYQKPGDSGMDVHAYLPDGDVVIESGFCRVVPTGLFFEIGEGFELQVRSRSGLATKSITVANSPGTVDSAFRGEVGVILRNDSHGAFVVRSGDRIAQFVFAPVVKAVLNEVSELAPSERGDSGFGSSGIK